MTSKTLKKIMVFAAFAASATAFQFADFEFARAQTSGNCAENASLTSPQVIPGSVNPGSAVNFKVQIYNSGNTRFYHGSYFQLVQKSGLNVTPPYGHLT